MNAAEPFSHWKMVRHGQEQALDGLAEGQLAFVPHKGLWSLGTAACHIANAEDGWFRYVVARELDEWPSIDEKRYHTVASIRALLNEIHGYTMAYLQRIDVADLYRTISAPWGAELTLRFIIWHVLEHEIHHRGETYLMLGLLGMEAPDFSRSRYTAGLKGSALVPSLASRNHTAKSDRKVVRGRWNGIAIGGPYKGLVITPTAAAQDSLASQCRPCGIHLGLGRIRAIRISPPFPNVSCHI